MYLKYNTENKDSELEKIAWYRNWKDYKSNITLV